MVTVPPAKKNGTVRAEPSLDAEIVDRIPGGEIVEVEDRQVVQGKAGRQVWFRVRGMVFGKPVEGWMHSDILKMMDEPQAPPR
jgi:predicted transcriptional regulator